MRSIFTFSLMLLSSFIILSCDNPESTPFPTNVEPTELKLHVPSPDWREQVVYFLMTDRFNDGNPNNNDQGAGEYEKGNGSRFNGGDIQGVIDQLDYIEELGATAVWTTPIFYNQWHNSVSDYTGYHGYWAVDFSQVDPHLGTLKDYQQLSDSLHRRDMYLIQDIVVNHTGNFFNYDGKYNPENTAENFVLLNDHSATQPAPTQEPFQYINRLDPEHVEKDIYNWTPSITDYQDYSSILTYQLATLADLNTTNELVIDKMKTIYTDWIEKVGVDSFRVDTVRYVDKEFFRRFYHDPDGVMAKANALGKTSFLNFSEIFEVSKPFDNHVEKRMTEYLGSKQKPLLNALINFPLYASINSVFAQGRPTAEMAYRLEQQMSVYPDPYALANFVDNHDVDRFLASGDDAAMKQAMATIFTVPGVPVIYQGDEQGFTKTRKAMFKGGYDSDADSFDRQSKWFKYIQKLTQTRKSHKALTHGDMKQLQSDNRGPGVLAFERSYQGEKLLVVMNTAANTVLAQISQYSNVELEILFQEQTEEYWHKSYKGSLLMSLPAKSIIVARINDSELSEPSIATKLNLTIDKHDYRKDFNIHGEYIPNTEILLIINSNLEQAKLLKTNDKGFWQYLYQIENLGKDEISLQLFDPKLRILSQAQHLTTVNEHLDISMVVSDPESDNHGFDHSYQAPAEAGYQGQMDILSAEIRSSGEILEIELTMDHISDQWVPIYGFDHVVLNLFFDFPEQQGLKALPGLHTTMPSNHEWNVAHVIYGWGNKMFASKGSENNNWGESITRVGTVSVNKAAKTITLGYRGSDYGLNNWQDVAIYISTWDITGEGELRNVVVDKPHAWSFKVPFEDAPRVMDDLLVLIQE